MGIKDKWESGHHPYGETRAGEGPLCAIAGGELTKEQAVAQLRGSLAGKAA